MQEKKQYKLNLKGANMVEGLQIDEPRFDEICDEAKIAHILGKDMVETFELALNVIQPQSMVEAALMGYAIGQIQQRAKQMNSNPLLSLLAQMGK
jgi:hypothetical protein